eukprot:scaffold273_cov242-Pinguiococcus_pyrenoidosus.AAC.8
MSSLGKVFLLAMCVRGRSLQGKSVGILGGGIAGLSCALALEERGIECLVYDTGKRGVGGRASSRDLQGQAVDHAVQFVTATQGSSFEALLARAQEDGQVQLWDGSRVGTVDADGFFQPDGLRRYIGSNELGMQGLVNHLRQNLKHGPVTDTWVSPSNGLRFEGSEERPQWGVYVNNKRFRQHDIIVIAHNGKCADRITSKTPAKQINRLLRVNFDNKLPPPGATRYPKMTLNAIYSVVVTVPTGFFPADFDGAFMQSANVSWIGCNSRKYERGSGDQGVEVWTLLSTPAFAKEHKMPQEFIEGTPTEALVVETLVGDVLETFRRRRGGDDEAFIDKILFSKVQLWGAGVPINRWAAEDGNPFLFDAAHGIGVVGDWLCKPSVEGAFLSGSDFGAWLSESSAEASAGLRGSFIPAGGAAGIGDVCDAPMAPEQIYMSEKEFEVVQRGRGGRGQRGGRGKGGRGGRGGRGGGRRPRPAN